MEKTENPADKLEQLNRRLEQARREAEYYRWVAQDSGTRRLREVVQLSRVIAQREAALQALRESEERLVRAKRMESLGLMAGGIAHDLNNILAGIVSYPDLLLHDLPADSPLRRPLETIRESGYRAAEVVSDLLSVARGATASKVVSNLNTLVDKYLNSAEHQKLQQERPEILFESYCEADLLNLQCSPGHIQKALMNLVRNASDSIEDRGTVVIRTANCYLAESRRGYQEIPAGEYTRLTITDTGTGIRAEDLERIFEPFYSKKVLGREGTGLGLAVVWNTVQDHQGYLHVESNPNGSRFHLYFPVVREHVTVEPQRPITDYQGRGEHILVVDDEPHQRAIACDLLSRLGYRAVAVAEGRQAVAYVQDQPVDLLLLDMIMPGAMSGDEVYEAISRIHPGQKAVIASGFAESIQVKRAQALGAGTFINKPYTLQRLGTAIQAELHG